nr:response regulator transcription factor [Pseudomonas sp. FFPRI_1]
MKIKILIADDHPVLASAIAHELSSATTLKIVDKVRNSTQVIERLSRLCCDVLIIDYLTPGGDAADGLAGLALLRRRYPELKIIVFTTIDNPTVVTQILRLGINSVLNKVDDINHLISAVHAVHAGAIYLSPRARSSTHEQANILAMRPSSLRLTRRETEVVLLYANGLSVTRIAEQLKRTKQTISAQKCSAMRKLGFTQETQLHRFVDQSGLAVTVAPNRLQRSGLLQAFPLKKTTYGNR